MKKYTFYILLLFVCSAVCAQQGTVTDAFTHKPITGATVTFDKSGKMLSSDSTGSFPLSCDDLPYYITVRFIGYEQLNIKVSNCTRPIRAEMEPSSIQMNEVQVTSWSTEKNNNNQLEVPQSVGVLSQADLNRGNGLALQDAIDLIPGVDMESRTPFGGQHIIIRGYYGGGSGTGSLPAFNTTGLGYQLSINNVPITDASGSTIMDDIDFSTLGKVEVIKGPQSVLYGSGIGGVVNMYTVRPQPNTTEFSQSALGGSYGLWRTNSMITTAGSNYDLVADYGHQNYNGFRPNDASSKDYLTFTGNYYTNKQTFTAYFSYSKSYEQLAGEQDSAEIYSHSSSIVVPTYLTNNSHVAIESFRGGVTDNFKFSKHFSDQTTVYVSGHSIDMPYAKGVTETYNLNFGGRTGFVYDQQFKSVGLHGILGASVLKTDQVQWGESFGSANDLGTTATTSSIFTEWNVNLPLQFSVKAGVSANFNRYTYDNYDSTNHLFNGAGTATNVNAVYFGSPTFTKSFSPLVTPTVSLNKVFNQYASVYANVSPGFTPPTIATMVITPPAGIEVNTGLKPERGIQYEVGTKGSFLHKKLSYQVALYFLDITNKLVSEEAAAGYTFTTNIGEERNLGAELALSYAIIENPDKPVSLVRPFITYTYADYTYHNFSDYAQINAARQLAEVNFSGNHVAGVAPNRFNAGFDFGIKYGVYFNATYQYVDKTPYTFDNQNYAKAYNLLGAKIGYRNVFFKHLGIDVYAGLDNILSATYYNELFVGEEIYQLGDGAFLPAPYKPTWYTGATVSYKF